VITFRKYILILTFLPLVLWGRECPYANGDCRKLLLDYLERMEGVGGPLEGKVYHLRYRMETEFTPNTGMDVQINNTEVLTSKERIMVHDQKMSVFGDRENIFVVLPQQKRIYWNRSDPRIFKEMDAHAQLLEVQRSLLNSAKAMECSLADEDQIIITVEPNLEFAKRANLVLQKITYDTKEHRVLKVENLYDGKSKIKRQVITYYVLDFDSAKKINPPIAELFKGNSLKPLYRDFEIIDNRKN